MSLKYAIKVIGEAIESGAGDYAREEIIKAATPIVTNTVVPAAKVVGQAAIPGTALLGVGSAGMAAGVSGSTSVALAGAQMAYGAATTAATIPMIGTGLASAIASSATTAYAAGTAVGTAALAAAPVVAAAAPVVVLGVVGYGIYRFFRP
jgi:hypothetical protein